MLAALILAVSIIALCRFGLYYWRALLTGVAAQSVSKGILEAARVENGRVTGGDFAMLAGLHDLTPDLNPGRGGLRFVRLYYRIVDGIRAVAGRYMPVVAGWSECELANCARYAAVQIERHRQDNLELAALARSY
jgi:hypothetical protein